MKKVIICLTAGVLVTLGVIRAQQYGRPVMDVVRQASAADTVRQLSVVDTSSQSPDTTAKAPAVDTIAVVPVLDTVSKMADTVRQEPKTPKDTVGTQKDSTAREASDWVKDADTTATASVTPKLEEKPAATDSAANKASSLPAPDSASSSEPATRQLDTRWFIGVKGQFQDFGFLEKNRKGYLSDANTLPFQERGNASFALSAYKNLTGRLSASADLGLSFGHVTNDDVLISQTKSKTYNLLNLSVYYHLLPASYRLQPYVTIGINDVINEASFLSAPIGIGAKWNSKKVMVLGQLTYGYGVSKNISNTTMYSVGIYLPLKNKKQRQQEKEDNSPYNRRGKDDDKKKDTSSKGNGGITINNYITINMDSVKKAHGLDDDDDNGGSGRRGRDGRDGGDGRDGRGRNGGGRQKGGLYDDLNLDEDFGQDDFKVDTINGVPVVRFVVYFEFNEYGLNSKAFSTIDNVIGHLKHKPNLSIEIKGYTDDVGTESYNNFLSRRRAKMVLEYMNSRGVPSDYMKAKAYGSDNPVADNKNPNESWLNRRAEIIVHVK